MVSGQTRIAAVIGDPVSHSLSPAMHNAAFAAVGLDALYVAFHVSSESLARAVSGMSALNLLGFNVTVPHKEAVVGLLESRGASVERTGAVNSVTASERGWHGENTDIVGVRRALEETRAEVAGRRVVLVGAGGAARAAVAALVDLGATRIDVANRTRSRAQAIAERFTGTVPIAAVGLESLARRGFLGDASVVINCTSIGLSETSFPDIDVRSSPPDCLYFDMIPKLRTPFLALAARGRRPRIDGSTMLLHQGAAAFTMWTRVEAPLDPMRRALHRAIRRQRRTT